MNWFTKVHKPFVLLTIFGIAMGFLEAIVVVYLRQIYYPEGFSFPLNSISSKMISMEVLREITTIVMLVTVGIIAGKNHLQRFAYLIYTFGIWDIFYYVGLKLLLNWPETLLTWDVLFLIPVMWLGPVLAPVICSLTMVFIAGSIVSLQERGCQVKVKMVELILILLGTFIIFYTFICDCLRIVIQGGSHFQEALSQYKPGFYNWYLFGIGEILIVYSVVVMIRRTIKHHKE